MKSDNYLSKLILILSILVSILVFIVFPMVLENTSHEEIAIHTIRDTWQDNQLLLPAPTKFAVTFADHNIIRIIMLSVLIFAGVLFEVICRNKMITGTYHSVSLLLCIMLGAYLFLACIVPYIPLSSLDCG